jgi:hypothetical protein
VLEVEREIGIGDLVEMLGSESNRGLMVDVIKNCFGWKEMFLDRVYGGELNEDKVELVIKRCLEWELEMREVIRILG